VAAEFLHKMMSGFPAMPASEPFGAIRIAAADGFMPIIVYRIHSAATNRLAAATRLAVVAQRQAMLLATPVNRSTHLSLLDMQFRPAQKRTTNYRDLFAI
jgi:hypothetical protein